MYMYWCHLSRSHPEKQNSLTDFNVCAQTFLHISVENLLSTFTDARGSTVKNKKEKNWNFLYNYH